VPLDHAFIVVFHIAAGDDAMLNVIAALLAIDIEARMILAQQHFSFLQPGEVLRRLGVDGVGIRVCPGRQIDFGTRDMEEAGTVPGCVIRRFRRGDHIVRKARHRGNLPRWRPQCLEWPYSHIPSTSNIQQRRPIITVSPPEADEYPARICGRH